MSTTIAHRPHVHHHLPLTPVLVVIVTALIAATLIWAVNLPETTMTTAGTEAVSAPAPAIVVPEPDNPVFRHDLMRMGATGQLRPYLTNLRHLVEGASPEAVSMQPYAGTIVSPSDARAANGR